MNNYDKRIVYFDLVEEDRRIGNGGFVKLIVQNGQLRLTINASGLHKTTKATEILFSKSNEVVSVDTIYIKDGKSVYSRLFLEKELREKGISLQDVYAITIPLNDNQRLLAVIKQPKRESIVKEKYVVREEPVIGDLQKSMQEVVEDAMQDEKQSDIKDDMQGDKQVQIPEAVENDMLHDNQYKEETVRIYDNKWKQLEVTFPHIHPFVDEREYLSIAPKDLVVLTNTYQSLAGNSFLLHGYYNYHHIILGKIVKSTENIKSEETFYVGVPGVFHEREKAVAIMFGFESFECASNKAETGTFGYYMKRVEI